MPIDTDPGDHFEAETLIRAHLGGVIPEFENKTFGLGDIAQLEGEPSFVPCAFVLWGGDEHTDVTGTPERTRQRIVRQSWIVLVCAINHADTRPNASARLSAGQLYARTGAVLDGWKLPSERLGRLTWVTARTPPTYKPGSVILPARFTATRRTIGVTL